MRTLFLTLLIIFIILPFIDGKKASCEGPVQIGTKQHSCTFTLLYLGKNKLNYKKSKVRCSPMVDSKQTVPNYMIKCNKIEFKFAITFNGKTIELSQPVDPTTTTTSTTTTSTTTTIPTTTGSESQTLQPVFPLQPASELSLGVSVQAGCPKYGDLPIKSNGKYICLWNWYYKNIGSGGPSVTGCQGDASVAFNNHQDAGSNYIPMGSFAVMPGCTLYAWTKLNFQGVLKMFTGYTYTYDNTWGIGGTDKFAPGPASIICQCGHQPLSCTPSDQWETLVTCDNLQGITNTECTYKMTVGTQHSVSTSKETEVVVERKVAVEVEIGAIFDKAKASASLDLKTGFKWSEAESSIYTTAKTIEVTDIAPPGKVLIIQQAVGHCGGSTIKTNMIKTIHQDHI